MHTAVRTKGYVVDHIKLALVAAGIVAAAVAGTTALTLTSNPDDTTISRAAALVTVQQPAWRFAEISQLPVSPSQRVDYVEMRFAEMNALPVTGVEVSLAMPAWRFVEINQLPEAAATAPVNRYDRFVEINQLPGDGEQLVAPEMVNGTRS
jgi:hypothetical protein